MIGLDLQINIDGHSFIVEDDMLAKIDDDMLESEVDWMWWI